MRRAGTLRRAKSLLALALALALGAQAGCGAVSGGGERDFGIGAGELAAAKIPVSAPILPLDPTAAAPLLTQLEGELAKADIAAQWRGVAYHLTQGNRLEPGWLLQTPNAWGRRADQLRAFQCPTCGNDFQLPSCTVDADCAGASCRALPAFALGVPGRPAPKLCLGHSDELVERFYEVIAAARSRVDVTTLAPPPDGRFLAAIRAAVTSLAYSGRAVTIRLLVGDYPGHAADPQAIIGDVIRDAAAVPASRLQLTVGVLQSCAGGPTCGAFSWNHAKIVAVDGRSALIGGHNLWTADYLLAAPVHDLTIGVAGPAAADAGSFADALWRYVCAEGAHGSTTSYARSLTAAGGAIAQGCLADDRRPGPGTGAERPTDAGAERPTDAGVSVMSVARLGSGVTPNFADYSDLARQLMFAAARRAIRLSQQDVGFRASAELGLGALTPPTWPRGELEAIADLLTRDRGEAFIIVSAPNAVEPSGERYGNAITPEQVVDEIETVAEQRSGMTRAELAPLLCRSLHVAPLRFGPDAEWPGGVAIANHAKLWIVDDRAFYLGSHNLYPVDLQEFGYIVEDRPAVAELLSSYWEKLWRWSRAAAVSGDDAPSCVLE